jgi:ABC-2 type transport system permease protein
MLKKFFMDNSVRISGMTSYFPPAGWAAEGILGDWGKLALYAAVSFGAAALVIGVLGIFYRKLSLLQAETPQATGRKGIQKGSIREGNAFKANVRREFVSILRVPSYAINILPIAFMPLLMVVMIGFSMNRGGSNGQAAFISIGQTSSAAIMCIMAAVIAFMSGMNPALSTAVTREGKGHDFIKALPVSPRTIIHAKIAVGFGLEVLGVIAAGIAFSIQVPGFVIETVMAIVLCLLFSFAGSCLALSRDVKKPKLDWVTEQEAVKQNFGVLISMLVSWATLAALGALGFVLVTSGWTLIPVFAVLAVILALMSLGAYTLLMKNVDKYYVKG